MFREMRRKNQLLSEMDNLEILKKGSSGVLALLGDEDYPYAVPLSYVYDNGKIYFHSAKKGHKIDAVKKQSKASFCVIFQDDVIAEEFTTGFRSVIVFGKIRILEDETEKRKAIMQLAQKYSPQVAAEKRDAAIEHDWQALCMLELSIEHMTGKEGMVLKRRKMAVALQE